MVSSVCFIGCGKVVSGNGGLSNYCHLRACRDVLQPSKMYFLDQDKNALQACLELVPNGAIVKSEDLPFLECSLFVVSVPSAQQIDMVKKVTANPNCKVLVLEKPVLGSVEEVCEVIDLARQENISVNVPYLRNFLYSQHIKYHELSEVFFANMVVDDHLPRNLPHALSLCELISGTIVDYVISKNAIEIQSEQSSCSIINVVAFNKNSVFDWDVWTSERLISGRLNGRKIDFFKRCADPDFPGYFSYSHLNELRVDLLDGFNDFYRALRMDKGFSEGNFGRCEIIYHEFLKRRLESGGKVG